MPPEEQPVVAAQTDDQKAQAATAATPGSTPTPDAASQDDSKPDLTTLPKYWQDHIKDLRTENKAKREAAQQAEREAKEKQDADLAARQEWEKLAKSREQEILTLKPKAEEAAELGELLTAQINKEIEKWPEEVKATAPDGEVSALEMVKWLDKTRPLAQKLMNVQTEKQSAPGGNSPGPKPQSALGGNQSQAATREDPIVDVSRRF